MTIKKSKKEESKKKADNNGPKDFKELLDLIKKFPVKADSFKKPKDYVRKGTLVQNVRSLSKWLFLSGFFF